MHGDLARLRDAHEAHKAGRFAEAMPVYLDLHKRYRGHPIAAQVEFLMAICAYQQRDLERAIRLMTHVADRLAPLQDTAHYNLGCFLAEVDDVEGASYRFERALALNPTMPEAMTNLGCALLGEGKVDEAIAWFEKSKKVAPQNAESRYNRGIGLLMIGDHANGWRDYEGRWEMPTWIVEHARDDLPESRRWYGKPLHGKRLLVAHEQGFGDCIQMMRYGGILRERKGGKVIWLVQPVLERYARHVNPEDTVWRGDRELPEYDVWCSMMSLPYLCQTRKAEDIPPLKEAA